MKAEINISKIEGYLYGIFNGTVSANTYVGTLPDTIKADWTDMCLIDCGTVIDDMDAYGKGTILIWLYAKPFSNGQKNVAKMSALETALNTAVSNASSTHYHISRRGTYTDYDTDRKWHVNIVELNISIF